MNDLMLGFDEFEKDMESIVKEVNDPEVMKDMLEAMAEPIVKEAQRIVIVDTGELKKGIVTKWSKYSPKEIRIGWSNRAFYGRMLEEGYHHTGSGKFIKKPHLRPAYNSKIDEGVRAALNVFREHKYYTK